MKQLQTATVKSGVEVKGKKVNVTEYAFQIRGEEAEYSAEEVTFKVLQVRNKMLKWNDAGTQVLGETVYFEMNNFKDAMIPDTLGGNALGRVFPSWEGVKKFEQARQVAEKKKAAWYTFLFGEVTFPGKAPVLVNYRITGSQSMDWGAIEKVIGKDLDGALLKLTAVGREGKEHLATTEYAILQQGLDTTGNTDAHKAILEFINNENEKVIETGETKKSA
jgi:hypothetical protein